MHQDQHASGTFKRTLVAFGVVVAAVVALGISAPALATSSGQGASSCAKPTGSTRPGFGNGDDNHTHIGPPGLVCNVQRETGTPAPTATPTATTSASPTMTASASPTATPTETASATPTATATPTLSPTPTPTESAAPTASTSPLPTVTPSSSPTSTGGVAVTQTSNLTAFLTALGNLFQFLAQLVAG